MRAVSLYTYMYVFTFVCTSVHVCMYLYMCTTYTYTYKYMFHVFQSGSLQKDKTTNILDLVTREHGSYWSTGWRHIIARSTVMGYAGTKVL